jgi:hypothetical protein
MVEFESLYFSWLKERISQEPHQPELDDKASELLNFLIEQEK